MNGSAPAPHKRGSQGARPVESPIIVEKGNGRRLEIIGEYIYELDASGGLRQGTTTEFAQAALKDMVKAPEDLRRYWSDAKARELLIEQLAREVVGLDVLAQALHLLDSDYFDVLQHVLFQQPALTRQQRVQLLREQHSDFFKRFETNPQASEFLDDLLDMYGQGNAPNLSDPDLFAIQPLNKRTRKEWSDAFKKEPTNARLGDVLKELQQLLYSI